MMNFMKDNFNNKINYQQFISDNFNISKKRIEKVEKLLNKNMRVDPTIDNALI